MAHHALEVSMRSCRGSRFACALVLSFASALSVACGDDDGGAADAGTGPDAIAPGFFGPDDYCPGSAHCTGQGDGKLYVGAGKATYTPEVPEPWTDTNLNSEYDDGEPFTDSNMNGTFDALWLFGGTPMGGVKTDLEARAIAFKHNDTLVVICYLDTIGMFADDFDLIRQDPMLAGLDIDYILPGSTHAHSTPDTIGISNANPLQTGYNPEYTATVRAAAARAIKDAVTTMKPAHMRIASVLLIDDPMDPMSGTDFFAKDIRDPVIYDPTLTIARFTEEADPDATIATLVNWGDHPEVALYGDSPDSLLASAHFPHWLRKTIEEGTAQVPGLGGTAVFVQGALGGQIGTLHGTTPIGLDGVPVTELSHEMDQALGESVAVRALQALEDQGEVVTTGLEVSYRTAPFFARVDNVGFQAFFLIGILAPHKLWGYDPEEPVGEGNEPWIQLRATYVQIGPLGIVSGPGELHPELWTGVHQDGSWSWGYPLIAPDNTVNLPDWDKVHPGPSMRELVLANPGVKYPVFAGQAEDYVGYIVPEYNYVLHPTNPYIEEAEGDHYEETYSLGPEIETQGVDPILELLEWRP
jgi:hypothetical protein